MLDSQLLLVYKYTSNTMLFNISNISPAPLHAQISKKIRAKILSGALNENDPLPTIRGLAADLKVGVITVQRAYDDLIAEGLIYARHGKGYYVSELTEKSKKELAKDRFKDSIESRIADGIETGLNETEMLSIVKRIMKKKDE